MATGNSAQDDRTRSRSKGRTFKHWLAGLMLLSTLIIVVLNRAEIGHFVELLRHAQPSWLAVGAALQICTYFSVAASWHSVLTRTNSPLSVVSMVPLAFAKLFSDQAMPSGGLSGNTFFVTTLKHRGIPRTIRVAVLLVSIISSYAADLLIAALSVLLLWYFHQLLPWILVVAAIFATVAVTIPSVALWLHHQGSKGIPAGLQRIPKLARFLEMMRGARSDLIRNPAVFWTSTGFQTLVILLDAATLWIMLLAVGQNASFWVALPSFFLASMVAMIGPIPLGLGTFEATSVTVLHLLGIPLAAALTATLLFLGFTMWLPMLPGMWMARREFSGGRSAPIKPLLLPAKEGTR